MPQHLKVTVVHCSGEEENFPAAELAHHTANTKGWQSPKFAEFPLELGLRLQGEGRVQQLQFLSHESKIASKIEVFISEPTPDSRRTRQFAPYESAVWRRLGYLSLSPNEQSEFLARELKTVHVACEATYVRLLFHRCHVNPYNFFNQVGLVAVAIIGDMSTSYAPPRPTAYEIASRGYVGPEGPEVTLKDMTPPKVGTEEYTNQRAELQFDAVTMKKLRELTAMKQRAVAEEDYDSAKRLKSQIDALRQVGSRLMQLEKQKKDAVASEDYDLAKALKAEIEGLRVAATTRPSSRGTTTYQPPGQPQYLPPLPTGPAEGSGTAAPLPPLGGQPLPWTNTNMPSVGPGFEAPIVPMVPTPPVQPHPPSTVYPPGVPHDAPGVPHDERPIPVPPPAYNESPRTAPAAGFDERPAVSRALANQAPPAAPEASGTDSPAAPTPRPYRRNIEEMINDPDPFNTGQGKPTGAVAGGGEADPDTLDIAKCSDWEQDVHNRVVALCSDAQQVAPLPEAKAREQVEYGNQFGEFGMRCLFSKQWQVRDAVVKALAGKLTAGQGDPAPFPGDRRSQTVQLFKYLVGKGQGLNDAVATVFTSSADALRLLIDSHLPVYATQPLQSVASILMTKVADSNPRIREVGTELLMTLANAQVFGVERVSGCVLTQPDAKKEAQLSRQLHARTHLIILLLDKFGVSSKEQKTGLTPDSVMTRVALPALGSSLEEVRKAAIKICAMLDAQGHGKAVERHTQMLKPALKAAIQKECGRGGDSADAAARRFAQERELMGSSVSVDGDAEVKKNMREARSAAKKAAASAPAAPRAGYSPEKSTTQPMGMQQHASGAPPSAGNQNQCVVATNNTGATEDDETLCQFCGKRDSRFNERLLDLHYLHSCPALYQCQHCEQVIEIQMLTEHWAEECEKKAMIAHEVTPYDPSNPTCVLCKQSIGPGEEGWEKHLLVDGCPANPRGKGEGEGAEFAIWEQMQQQAQAAKLRETGDGGGDGEGAVDDQ